MNTSSPSHLVREFHQVFGLDHPEVPTPLPPDRARNRQRILDEEVAELAEAARTDSLAEIARELADVVYVAYGTAISYGIDLDAVLVEIHRANLSKLGPDGQMTICDGKIQKGQHFQPPDVARVLRDQLGTTADDPASGHV